MGYKVYPATSNKRTIEFDEKQTFLKAKLHFGIHIHADNVTKLTKPRRSIPQDIFMLTWAQNMENIRSVYTYAYTYMYIYAYMLTDHAYSIYTGT